MLFRLSEQDYLHGELNSEIRHEHDEWQLAADSPDEPRQLASIGTSLTLDEIYEDVRLDAQSSSLNYRIP